MPNPNDATVTFVLPDRPRRLAGVRLMQEVGLPEPLDFVRADGRWQLQIPRPDVSRMEYLFEVADHNGHRWTISDPANPQHVPGAFGDKSVLEFADYRAPAWLAGEPVAGTERDLQLDAPALGSQLTITVWSPEELDDAEPAPLLLVHDGPEYARLGGLLDYLGAGVGTGALPPLRAALLAPGDRNAWYSANPDYARVLCGTALDALDAAAPATVRIGVGVSLGALAMLHAHRGCPGAFDALLLQSGSFFTPDLDPQEREFAGFAAVAEFVDEVAAADHDPAPVPTVLTCGTVEENRANNEAMAAHLERLGYPVQLVVVRDAHNYTGWRDALDPHLTRLISGVARRAA